MKITKEQLKNIVRETLTEESEYQTFFKKALEKAGKSIPSMSDEEKKAFFNKIEKTWQGRGQKSEGNAFGAAVAQAKKDGDDSFEVDGKEYKTERFGRGHEGPTFGSEEESMNEAQVVNKKTGKDITRHVLDLLSGKIDKKKFEKLTGLKKESVNEAYDFKPNKNMNNLMKGRKIKNVVYSDKLGFAIILDNGKFILIRGHRATPGSEKELELESVNEGASTEEKRIAMLAVRKQAKYRNVDLTTAIQDQIRALEDLMRDAKKGKLK
jgi:hypothetical protein